VRRLVGAAAAVALTWVTLVSIPSSVAASVSGAAQATLSAPATTGSHTGPGLKTGTGKDAVSGRAVRGIALLVLAFVVVGWLFRLRVRDWMLGRQSKASSPPDLGSDERRR